MTMPPLRPRDRRQALAALEAALVSLPRPNPLLLAWRWRYELILATGMTLGAITLTRIPAAIWMLAGITVLAAAAAVWPPARRLLAARAWCVITPHRVRSGCAGAWIHSRKGKLPAVLFTRGRPFGERVYLWCRAGTCAADFESALALLITSCWAYDMRVTLSSRHAQLVTLDVIRRAALKHPDSPTAKPGTRRPGSSPPWIGRQQATIGLATSPAQGNGRRPSPATENDSSSS